MIQEGWDQARAGHTLTIDDVVVEFKREGLLPADFVLANDQESARGTT